MAYYDRYGQLRDGNGDIRVIPFIAIPKNSSDIYLTFDKRSMRMDTLSYKYYGDANYGWLIMQANPQYGGYEYAYQDGITIRVPYPLSVALKGYEDNVKAATHKG